MGFALGNENPECASAARSTLHRNFPAVKLHQFLHQRQANAGAFEGSAGSALHPMEPLEQARQIRLGDSGTCIGDRELDLASLVLQSYANAALECELEGVGHQVQYNFFQ